MGRWYKAGRAKDTTPCVKSLRSSYTGSYPQRRGDGRAGTNQVVMGDVRTLQGLVVPERFQLTECINLMVLESQLTHKIVNLLFTITS